MLHELLLALCGHTGEIFIEGANGFEVLVPDHYFHPGEIQLLRRILEYGSNYGFLKKFTNQHRISISNLKRAGRGSSQHPLQGVYIQGFCESLKRILDSYLDVIVKLEGDILKDPALSLSHIEAQLQQFYFTLQTLVALVKDMENRDVHGCQILDILSEHASTGFPEVQSSIKMLLQACFKVALEQIIALTLYGIVIDHFDEFFIQLVVDPADEESSATKDNYMEKSMAKYSFRTSTLPKCIPMSVLKTILFIGESIKIFEKDQEKKKMGDIQTMYNGQEVKYFKKFQELQKLSGWNLHQFEGLVNEIRDFVAERLYQLVVIENNLEYHLRLMKDFYLLGRGELFAEFLHQANHLLYKPPTKTTENGLNKLYELSAQRVLLGDDITDKFYFKVAKPSEEQCEAKTWDLLTLHHKIEWPLHIFFTPNNLRNYNIMFFFLLRIKRIQIALGDVWALQTQSKRERKGDSISYETWEVRHHMSYLVNNLQYYLHVDALDHQFSILLNKLHSIKDIEKIQDAHAEFQSNIIAQAFLTNEAVLKCLNSILDLCLEFCTFIQEAETMDEERKSKLEAFGFTFRKNADILFFIFANLKNYQKGQHLAQFLLRVDYNKWFSKQGLCWSEQ